MSPLTKPRISVNCASLAEAGWLAAVVLVPVAGDLSSAHHFTAIKTALIQTIGAICGAALVFHLLAQNRTSEENQALPLRVFAALTLLGVSFLSWVFAVDPSRVGESGSAFSLGPPYLGPLILIFLAVCVFLRSCEQLQRLALATLTSGFAVALLAVMQKYGLRLPGHEAVLGMEIFSFVGGPIFLAGYLLMILPVAVWNLHRQISRAAGKIDASLVVAALVAAVVFAALIACNKRGPFVGALGTAGVGLALVAAVQRNFRLLTVLAVLACFSLITLVGLATLRKSGTTFEGIPALAALSAIVPVGGMTGDSYRTNLWNLLPSFVSSPEPLLFPSGQADPLHQLRPWLGYGPDNVQAVLPSKYVFLQSWPSDAMEVSCHSLFWDTMMSLGALGVLALFIVFFAIWYAGLQNIGRRPPPVITAAFLSFFSAGLAGLGAALLLGEGFFGLGAQAGFLAALTVLAFWRTAGVKPEQSEANEPVFLIVALMAALAGHWMESGFIFSTEESSVLYWVFAGAIVGWLKVREPASAEARVPQAHQKAWAAWITAALLIGIVYARTNIGAVLTGKVPLANIFGSLHVTLALISLALLALVMACVLLVQEAESKDTNNTQRSQVAAISLAVVMVYTAALFLLAILMQGQGLHVDKPWLAEIWSLHFWALTLAGICGIALAIVKPRTPASWQIRAAVCAGAGVVAISLWFGPATDLRAGVSAGMGRIFVSDENAWLARSIQLKPNRISYHQRLAANLTRSGLNDDSPQKRESSLAFARKWLDKGLSISDFNLLSAKLGKVLLLMALCSEDPSQRRKLANAAAESLAKAVRFAPQNELAWVDAAFIQAEILGDEHQADRMLSRADKITFQAEDHVNVVEQAWGMYYTRGALEQEQPGLRQHYALRAKRYLDFFLKHASEALADTNGQTSEELLDEYEQALVHHAVACEIMGDPDGAERSLAMAERIAMEDRTKDAGRSVEAPKRLQHRR